MASGEAKGVAVMVTGASGFIGSTLVRRLLDRGYNVHAGVLNPGQSAAMPWLFALLRMRWSCHRIAPWRADDRAETDHLLALAAGAGEGRLRIFRCDLFDGAALLDAARGCSGVFHLASPCILDAVSDPQVALPRPRCPLLSTPHPRLISSVWFWPQKQLIVPAVEGTLNVLRAAKEAGGVRRVVVTSSISAIVPSPGWPAGEVRDERCWTDVDYCEENGVSLPIPLSLSPAKLGFFSSFAAISLISSESRLLLRVAMVLCFQDTGREGGVEVCRGERTGCGYC
jgi:NAD(P)-dependent dehydrogenase (short-subunit alcohol dehydrogenase family)